VGAGALPDVAAGGDWEDLEDGEEPDEDVGDDEDEEDGKEPDEDVGDDEDEEEEGMGAPTSLIAT
jgi:hypothetical protein